MEHEAITGRIIGCAMAVHRGLGPGFLESVYQHALVHELRKAGLPVQSEVPIQVHYDGVVVGAFICDLLVGGVILIENKAVLSLAPAHEVQLVNYLTATGIEVGLLLNFGAQRLEYKRKTRTLVTSASSNIERNERPKSALVGATLPNQIIDHAVDNLIINASG